MTEEIKPAEPSNRLGLYICLVIAVWFVASIVYGMLFPPSPAELAAAKASAQASQQLEQTKRDTQALHQQYLDGLCHQEAVCERYGPARQECATAGNYNNCITIKLGSLDASTVDACTEDGKLAFRPSDMPNGAVCWVKEKLH